MQELRNKHDIMMGFIRLVLIMFSTDSYCVYYIYFDKNCPKSSIVVPDKSQDGTWIEPSSSKLFPGRGINQGKFYN